MSKNALGELAMIIIADYPLYASTSNISYEDAIAVTKVFYPDTGDWDEVAGKELK